MPVSEAKPISNRGRVRLKHGCFGIVERVDGQDGDAGRGELQRQLLLPLCAARPGGGDGAPAGISHHPAQQVADGRPFALVVDLIDVVDEQGGTAAGTQLVKELIA